LSKENQLSWLNREWANIYEVQNKPIPTVHRPSFHKKGWGWEDWIVNNTKFCGKILHFNKDKQCSWHYHERKAETFHVLEGRFEVTIGWSKNIEDAKVLVLNPGESIDIPVGLNHRMKGLENVNKLLEVSTQHFETDSYRIERGD